MREVTEKPITNREARDLIRSVSVLIRKNNLTAFDVGGKLLEIKLTGAYRKAGFPSFESFVAELPGSARTFRYWISIYEKYVVELRVSRKQLAQLEWSKARIMCKVTTSANVLEWIEKSRHMGRVELLREIQKALGAWVRTRKELRFNVYGEDVRVIETALDACQKHYDIVHVGDALVALSRAFLSGSRRLQATA